jgi:phospholipid/cholesterol/gamma-HCH transport system substrate-binding protein
VGIVAAAVIGLVTVLILLFARVGALHGKKVTLYVVTDDASGVLAGTEVWLSGEKEGLVKDIKFRPASVDTLERLLIVTEVLKDALPNVRRDSYAQIRPGANLIGVPVVYISPGTTAAPSLRDGDTIYTRPKPEVVDIATGIGSIAPEVAALGKATAELANKLDRPVGTIGNARRNGFEDFADVSAGVSSLNARASRGTGTIAAIRRGGLTARASRTMAAADSIRQLTSSNKGTLGRFRRDSTLMTKAGHVLAELDTLRGLVLSPVGTMERMHSDTVLAQQLARERVLLAALIKDMKSNPTRYISF